MAYKKYCYVQEAVRGPHESIVTLLIRHGAKVLGVDGTSLIDLSESPLARGLTAENLGAMFTGIDHDWEIDPASLKMGKKIGEHGLDLDWYKLFVGQVQE